MVGEPRPPRAILDTSVIIAALQSASGGSAKVLGACWQSRLLGAVSDSTRDEIVRNLFKFNEDLLTDFDTLLRGTLKRINSSPAKVDYFSKFVDPDDAHLLAACELWNADYLVSLNRKHLINQQAVQKVIKARIVTPKDLIAELGL